MADRIRISGKRLQKYRESLTVSHRKFDSQAKPKIEQLRKYFKGEQWASVGGTGRGIDFRRVVVNLLFADIKVMLPVLALRNPRVFVKPSSATVQVPTVDPQTGQPSMVAAQIINSRPVKVLDSARAQEALVNWRWRMLEVNKSVRRCLIDALLSPFGVMKLGYSMTTEKVEISPVTGEEKELLEPNELIRAESPFAVRWSPMDFRVDPEARYPDLSDAEWVAFGWLAKADDLRRNPRFKNTRDLRPTVEMREEYTDAAGPGTQGRTATERDEENMRVQLWEIWNKRTQERIVLADEHDKPLELVDWPVRFKNFPAETLCFTEYPDEIYGPADLWHVVGQQDAYNEVASMILNHVKRFLRKYIATRGAFDEKELDKLISPVDGLVAETDASDASKAIIPMPDASIPVDWWQTRVNFREDHDRISGIADFIRGVAEKVDTATEASFIQSNLNVRTSDTRDVVERFAERISRQLLQIDAQTLDIPTAIPVIGPDGALAYGEFVQVISRELLETQTDVEVEIGSMQPINQQVRKKDILEIYMLLRNDPLIDQFELRRRLIPAYRDSIPDLDKLFLSRDQANLVIQQMALQQQGRQSQPGNGMPRPGRRPTGPAAGPIPVQTPEQGVQQ